MGFIEEMRCVMLFKRSNKKKGEFIFFGTYNEFIEKLKQEKFWKSDEKYNEYIKNHTYINGTQFGEYRADFRTESISMKGMGYLSNNTSTGKSSVKTKKIVLEIDSTGFSQEEINSALAEMMMKLKKMQDNNSSSTNKRFSLIKISD